MAESAMISLCGRRIMEVNPGFITAMWEFDNIVLQLLWGLSKWLNPRPTKVRQHWNDMGAKFFNIAFEEFDWNGPDADTDWEPVFGSRFARQFAKWGKESGFKLQTRSGQHLANIIG